METEYAQLKNVQVRNGHTYTKGARAHYLMDVMDISKHPSMWIRDDKR